MNPRCLTPSMSPLVALDAAARRLSFTDAAAELALTLSAVSRQVQALEELMGVCLFRRLNRKLTLTAICADYHREIKSALQRVRSTSLQAIASGTGRGTLDLAALPTFTTKWLLPRLSDFYKRHPGILINLHSRIGQFDLQRAGMDAAIGVGDGKWPGLNSYRLRDETLLPIISPTVAATLPVSTPRRPFPPPPAARVGTTRRMGTLVRGTRSRRKCNEHRSAIRTHLPPDRSRVLRHRCRPRPQFPCARRIARWHRRTGH